jgi:hypothetical protein
LLEMSGNPDDCPEVPFWEVWASRAVADLIPVAYGWTMIAVLTYP